MKHLTAPSPLPLDPRTREPLRPDPTPRSVVLRLTGTKAQIAKALQSAAESRVQMVISGSPW